MTDFLFAAVAATAVPVIGLVVALLVIRGPARWTAGVGLLLMVGTSLVSVLLPWVVARLDAPSAVVVSLWGLVSTIGWALLALSIVHATLWSRRQPTGLQPDCHR